MSELFATLSPYTAEATPPKYAQLLRETHELYQHAAELIVVRHAGLVPRPDGFPALMEDLHRGLLLKVYFTVCEADRRWSKPERELAADLAEHVWGKRLTAASLADAMREASSRTQSLPWDSLLAPFRRLAPLADCVPTLETLVIRQSNLLARCDGVPEPAELAAIHDLIHAVRVAIDPEAGYLPVDEQPTAEVAAACDAASPTGEVAKPPSRPLEEVLAELEALVGLDEVKREVRSLANFLSLQRKREAAGLPSTGITLHMVFLGNPGTGKTTVARLVGEALAALGVLPSGQLVETDRGGLVAEYAGQTAGKVNERIDEAMGGVLFIDEAYGIVAEGSEDAFGAEAMQTLLKRAEDDRDRLSIVLAGYPEPMDRLLSTNPGLASRFSRRFVFHDYAPLELCRIFGRLLEVHHYRITPAARLRLIQSLTRLHRERDEHFGNGRAVRNLFERAVVRMADRLATLAEITDEQLITFEADDLGPGGDEPSHLRISCPACGHSTLGPASLLGARLGCPKCAQKFEAEWGELEQPGAQ